MRSYIKGNIDELLALSTLAAATLIGGNFDNDVNERTLVTSIVSTWSMQNFTPQVADGPIVFGVAHSDYTDAEVEEVLQLTSSWQAGAMIEQEKGARKVKIIGTFETPEDATKTARFNDGRPMKTKLNWVLDSGQTLKQWCYNQGTDALGTTSPTVRMQGHANLFVL